MARGELRIYLGAAPGVGKTYAMLIPGGGQSVVVTLPAVAPRSEAAGTLVPGPGDTDTCPRLPSGAQT